MRILCSTLLMTIFAPAAFAEGFDLVLPARPVADRVSLTRSLLAKTKANWAELDGPGQLIGFVYGVRLIDNEDRWSHGGAENLYIDGLGEHPAFVRGIGGEDTFGPSYGGAHHPPQTHLFSVIPYYHHEDIGEARRAQRLVGYRFFAKDTLPFYHSLHMRFGTMRNNIRSTVYWYQEGQPRDFVKLPDWKQLLPNENVSAEESDLELPDSGRWIVSGPFENGEDEAIESALSGERFDSESEPWKQTPSLHGFVDFNHDYRPRRRGVGAYHRGKAAQAECILDSPQAGKATLRLAWDDRMVLQVNDSKPIDLGDQPLFRSKSIQVPVKKGNNRVRIVLSNEQGTNHGGWAFAFKATDRTGRLMKPNAPAETFAEM